MLGKSEWTLFFQFQTASVRTQSYVHFILPRIHLQTKGTIQLGIFKILNLKDNAVPTILDTPVMSQHTSVSNSFY